MGPTDSSVTGGARGGKGKKVVESSVGTGSSPCCNSSTGTGSPLARPGCRLRGSEGGEALKSKDLGQLEGEVLYPLSSVQDTVGS